jgi:hypothetical protein
MTVAFEEALQRLNVTDREVPMATSVAKKIIRLLMIGHYSDNSDAAFARR